MQNSDDRQPVASLAPAGPLEGLKAIELGGVVAASFGARLMADLGAEVIKVEAPDRLDPLRDWGRVRVDGHPLWWPVQSRNKKLVTLNLRDPRGAQLLLDLCARSDVLLENFRPGTLERWGLGYETLAERNPGLILARISGFGQTGPYATRPGYAAIGEAMGGLRYINGFPDRPPARSGLSLGDSLAGMFAMQGVLAALYERQRSGKGQVIDVALTEACLAMMECALAEFDRGGYLREPAGTGLPGIAPSNIFRSKDDHWIVIAANQDQMFERLCDAMGRRDLLEDERFADHVCRGQNQEEIEAIVSDWVGGLTKEEADRILVAHDVVAGPVYSVADILADEQYRAREMIVTHHSDRFGDFESQGVTPKFSRTPGSVRWAGPSEPGAHNDEVFGELLGFDASELEALREDGVI